MKQILLAIFLIFAPVAAHAQTAQVMPPGVPTVLVPNYNVTIGLWMYESALGWAVGEFNLQPNGTWTLAALLSNATETLDADVAAAGGPLAYIQNVLLPAVNMTLSERFPAIPAPGSGTTTATTDQQIDTLLASTYTLKYVNGLEVLAPK